MCDAQKDGTKFYYSEENFVILTDEMFQQNAANTLFVQEMIL